MKVSKQRLIDYLRTQGRLETAGAAFTALPDMVDVVEHAAVLRDLGIDLEEVPPGHPPGPAGLGDTTAGPYEEPTHDRQPGPAGLNDPDETDDPGEARNPGRAQEAGEPQKASGSQTVGETAEILPDDYPSDPDDPTGPTGPGARGGRGR